MQHPVRRACACTSSLSQRKIENRWSFPDATCNKLVTTQPRTARAQSTSVECRAVVRKQALVRPRRPCAGICWFGCGSMCWARSRLASYRTRGCARGLQGLGPTRACVAGEGGVDELNGRVVEDHRVRRADQVTELAVHDLDVQVRELEHRLRRVGWNRRQVDSCKHTGSTLSLEPASDQLQ